MASVALLSAAALAVSLCLVASELPKAKFEYKLSFKGPHLIQRDKSVPFWEYSGDALANDDSIRVTPSLRSKKGQVWSRERMTNPNWQIDVVVKVTGRGRIGADGMAIWFTETKGTEGPVFGSNDYWKGLGIFLDSFDNDGQHNNPYILAVVNDGTKQFDHTNDGSTQQLGGCLKDFRNKPFPVRIRVEYYNKALTVMVNNGLTNNLEEYELCLRAENVVLPPSGHFGVTAATGGLADDHDVLAFLTHTLMTPSPAGQAPETVSEDERKKFEKEFEEYYSQLEKAKEEFQKQHPEKMQDPYRLPDDNWFEGQGERELKQIFDGQTALHNTLKDVSRRLDELVGRQELTLSRVSALPTGQVVQQPAAPGQQPQQMVIDTIKRHEVDRVLNNQNELLQQVRDIRGILAEVQARTNSLQAVQGGGQGGGHGDRTTYETVQALNEVKGLLNNVKYDTSQLMSQPRGGNCPPVVSNCLSPVIFFVALAAHFALTLAYFVYRQSKEAQAKKFY